MAFYLLGDYIRKQRERLGVTQEELCEGICSTGTLSKIENGRQGMRLSQYIALMQRLGLPIQQMNVQVTQEEMEWHNLKAKIQYKTALGQWDIEDELCKLDSYIKDSNKLEEQFILFNRAIVDMKSGKDINKVLDMLIDAIKCTYADFDIDRIESVKLLTSDEIIIILNIAIVFNKQGNVLKAVKLGYFLKDYMEKGRLEYDEIAKVYPLILFDLSIWLGECNRFEEALELCNEGIEYPNKHGKLNAYTELVYNKSRYLFKLNRDEEAKKYMLYAYCISDMRCDEKMKKLTKKCLDELKVETFIN